MQETYSPRINHLQLTYAEIQKVFNQRNCWGWFALQTRYFLNAWIPMLIQLIRYKRFGMMEMVRQQVKW